MVHAEHLCLICANGNMLLYDNPANCCLSTAHVKQSEILQSSVLHHGVHLGPVVCGIWSLPMSRWTLRPRTFPWWASSLWCLNPNRSRCYGVHICKYLPWWGACEIEGGARWMATLTGPQILASELASCFQSQRLCWKGSRTFQFHRKEKKNGSEEV